MNVGEAIAEIFRLEGIETVTGYPRNNIFEHAARIDIRSADRAAGAHRRAYGGCDLAP